MTVFPGVPKLGVRAYQQIGTGHGWGERKVQNVL